MNFFTENILLIFLLPLLSSVMAISANFSKFALSKNTVNLFSIFSAIISLIFAAVLYYNFGYMKAEPVDFSVNWFVIGDLNFSLGILFDDISVLFLLILTAINFIVRIYSVSYMCEEKNYNLYIAFLDLFNISMSGFVLSSNFPQTYLFIELVGVCSYLLINFYFNKPQVSESAKRAFIMNRFGDMLLFAGIIILIYFISTYPISEGSVLLSYYDLPETAADFYVYLSDTNFYLACMLMFGGAIVKSVQFPMQIWLIEAMKAPTPVNALIHSATMVTAGIFLTIRLLPLFELSVPVLNTIIYAGLFTAVTSAFFAIGQTEIKKMLAYLTSSQLGLILAAAGTLASDIAVYYAAVNSFAMSLLFLIMGFLIITFANGSQKIEKFTISVKQYPLLAFCGLLSVFSLSGMFLGGFYANNAVFSQIVLTEQKTAVALFLIAIFLSAYCLFLLFFRVFNGQQQEEKKKIPFAINFSIIVCTLFVILVTFLNNRYVKLSSSDNFELKIFDFIPITIVIIGTAAIIAYFINFKKKQPMPKILNNLSLNGGYISHCYNWFGDNIFEFFGNFVKITDKLINLFVNIQAYFARFFSWCIAVSQIGNIQTYLSFAIFSIIILFLLYMLLILGLGANV